MTLDQLIAANESDATVAALWPEQPENHLPVPAISVAQWLGEAGLRERLEMFLERPRPAQTDPAFGQTIALRSGIKQLLSMQANPSAELIVAPGTGNRALLDGGVASGVLLTDDRVRLLARARPMEYVAHTAETVAERRAAMVLEAAAKVRSDEIEALWGLAVAEHTAANALHQTRNSKLADLRNDPALPVPATLGELDGAGGGEGM